ncbi:MAG: family 43 glycosylhydrolase [Melioribacteraceae bacterium]|nr:family 43 glycosylhydrolase [Melioribacteraceae bacterium]
MKLSRLILIYLILFLCKVFAQPVSLKTFMNPVIPGDHPDPTLTRIGNHFYTSGSSFNPTPKIYHSTDLVHWEVISQPVSPDWSQYGDEPGGGIWGGHTVFYDGKYWHYFGRGGGSMYFVTANQPEGPWSEPTTVLVPAGLWSLGVDNSIFIDEDTGKWYLLTKAGPQNNHIVELGNDGQPTGKILDLTWLNPDADGNPYGWAEGPVMWKHNGYYYYSFAQHLVGDQYVMRSDTLTDDESAWTIYNGSIFTGSRATFNRPNHISPAVLLDDGTSWVIAHSYHSSSSWYAHGRQGLLCQVTYNDQGFPVIQYPPDDALQAPDLPSSGIPWMVPKSDMFDETTLKPEWSFLGYTAQGTYSLDVQEGWLYLEPYGGSNTVIQNDGEHSYSLITRVEFEPASTSDEAGLWIINGPETLSAKVYSTKNSDGEKALAFSFDKTLFSVVNKIGSIVWLKLVRAEHMISGYYSSDGIAWTQIGEAINASSMDVQQTDFNNFTGNQQGLYVKGNYAFFDLYIYRDAYSQIIAAHPANQYGTDVTTNRYPPNSLDLIENNDWAMYAGVEFGGNTGYNKTPDSLEISAACTSSGGIVEIWIDSLDTGEKIAECNIENTGSSSDFQIFKAPVENVSGSHDVYLRFTGDGTSRLFRINWFRFKSNLEAPNAVDNNANSPGVNDFHLNQNFPNPFNPATNISYYIPRSSSITLKIYNLLGQEIMTLFEGIRNQGNYTETIDAGNLSNGVYIYTLTSENFAESKKLMILK